MKARGIDPGDEIGWCDLERVSAGVFNFIACGTWKASEIARSFLTASARYGGVDVFSVETPMEMHFNDIIGAMRTGSSITTGPGAGAKRIVQTVRSLLETRALAERIACGIVAAGGRIVEPTAAECRRALGVKFGAQRGNGPKLTPDQQVKAALQMYVRGWPARSNVHERDAGAAAFLALVMAENAAEGEPAPRGFRVPPPGTYGPGDYGPDSFGGSDYE